jgi:hypothetical protein
VTVTTDMIAEFVRAANNVQPLALVSDVVSWNGALPPPGL